MIVWGAGSATGGVYDPGIDSWKVVSVSQAPTARSYHTAVWTGSEMIIWGGVNGSTYFNSGGIYNPTADSWNDTASEASEQTMFLYAKP